MKFRSARHTTNLKAITHFYHELLGLDIIGLFEGHDAYDGIFFGKKNENIEIKKAKNPYWEENGITILDPDRYHVVIVKPTQ